MSATTTPPTERALRSELEATQARLKEKTQALSAPVPPEFVATTEQLQRDTQAFEASLASLRAPLELLERTKAELDSSLRARQEVHRGREHGSLRASVVLVVLALAIAVVVALANALFAHGPVPMDLLAVGSAFVAVWLWAGRLLRAFAVPSLRQLRGSSGLSRLAVVFELGALGTLGRFVSEAATSEDFVGGRSWAFGSLVCSLVALGCDTLERARRPPSGQAGLLRTLGLLGPVGLTLAALVEQSIASSLKGSTVISVGFLGACVVTIGCEGLLRRRGWPWLRRRFGGAGKE